MKRFSRLAALVVALSFGTASLAEPCELCLTSAFLVQTPCPSCG